MIIPSTYSTLLTSQYRAQPKFTALVAALTQAMADGIAVLHGFPQLFDLDQASGDQLDKLGEWIGFSRICRTLITGVYFSFDTAGLGFDQGVIQSTGNPSAGVVVFDDATYRLFLKLKIATNNWDGSMQQANQALLSAFPDGAVKLRDNFDMTQTFVTTGTPLSALFLSVATGSNYPFFKTAGVALA